MLMLYLLIFNCQSLTKTSIVACARKSAIQRFLNLLHEFEQQKLTTSNLILMIYSIFLNQRWKSFSSPNNLSIYFARN